jgi:transketolase C-terminal domain/subunit
MKTIEDLAGNRTLPNGYIMTAADTLKDIKQKAKDIHDYIETFVTKIEEK